MAIRMRDYHWAKDFESVRGFLTDIFDIRKAYTNWLPSELENLKFGPGGTQYRDEEDEYLKIWETFDEDSQTALRIIAATYAKPSGRCWLSIHPNITSVAREIVLWMQNRVKEMKGDEDEEMKMTFVVDDDDEELILLLSDLGFQKGEIEGDKQVRPIDLPVPTYSLPEG